MSCKFNKNQREFSSAGSEHLPYKQRVTGSNPVTPTKKKASHKCEAFFVIFIIGYSKYAF